jgi:hypothetical protein
LALVASDRPRLSSPGLKVSLAELLGCLQEETDDDCLVVAVVADLMERGRLRSRGWRTATRLAYA